MLKYEETYRSDYTSRLFIAAGSLVKLADALELLLDLLGLPGRDNSTLSVKVTAFKHWLSSHEGWLLLIDNVGEEEYDTLLDILPSTPKGHVILTSQRRGAMETIAGRIQMCLEIKEPSVDESIEMFLESCELHLSAENQRLAHQIVQDVGFLPHAVQQSASYIQENGINLNEYLVRYQKAPDQVRSPNPRHTAH